MQDVKLQTRNCNSLLITFVLYSPYMLNFLKSANYFFGITDLHSSIASTCNGHIDGHLSLTTLWSNLSLSCRSRCTDLIILRTFCLDA